MKRIAILVPAVMLPSACAYGPGSQVPAPLAISVARGPCFGFCPVFEASADATGRVTFEGGRHTEALGHRSTSMAPADFARLAGILDPLRPAAGEVRRFPCQAVPSDTSTLTIRWTQPGSAPAVLEYRFGCRHDGVSDVEAALEETLDLMGVTSWAAQRTREGVPRG